jgi:hypothetical protein
VPNKAPKEVKKSGVRFAAEPEMEEIETATEVLYNISFNVNRIHHIYCFLLLQRFRSIFPGLFISAE